MKFLLVLLAFLGLCVHPASSQLDTVSMTPTAVTLVSDTGIVSATVAPSAVQPASYYRQYDFRFDAPSLGGLLGLSGTGLFLLFVLPLLVLVVAVVFLVRALRRPPRPRTFPAGAKASWIHARKNQAIRLAATGAGIALLGLVIDWDFLAGAGLLVACVGGGNYWTACRDGKFYEKEKETNDKPPCDNTKNCSDGSSTTES